MVLGRIAGAVGRGLAAGLVGSLVMTLSSTLEMRLRQRGPSPAPGRALERILRVVPETEAAGSRLQQIGHYGYGTAWGGVRGLIAGWGVPRWPGAVLHGLALWGTEQVMLPQLDLSPPAWEWGPAEIAIDAWHHVVYVVATDVVYAALDRD